MTQGLSSSICFVVFSRKKAKETVKVSKTFSPKKKLTAIKLRRKEFILISPHPSPLQQERA